MFSLRDSDIDALLQSWSFWCEGYTGLLGGGTSMLAKLIDGKGQILFGGSGGSSAPCDSVEARIEAVVMRMAAKSPDRADVLRMEYSAGWWGVCERRQIKGYDPRGTDQLKRSQAMVISLRTYKRRLSEAREEIKTELRKFYER
ncbi:hypothetical protein [Pseudomonas sp. PARCl1]|jgi:hypothetical protein|uniref:hypothetical protein n=1 Tax=Pseudomonas sp. PARCl1 TaxID=2853444 RepID=UPI001C753C71|nr:hypothetical protein [Pseudomonas sp. PARCl1]QXM18706.1 hypothetical protein [Pseudomonas phage PARCL1pr]DAY63726.1 MAG TPA: DNA-directed RNA polymerase subunit alpha [Caudoviricetes sp.]